MKQFLLKSWLTMLCLLVGVGTSWAEDVINNSSTSSKLGNTATSSWVDAFDLTLTSGAVVNVRSMGTKSTSNALQWNANGYLYMKTSGGKLKSVTIKGASKTVNVYASNTAYSAAPSGTALGTISVTSSGATYNFTSSYTYLALKGTASSTSITEITIEYETTPTVAHTVTFNAGSNGTCSTSSLAESEPGAGVTLPNVTANEGWAFQGWSTSSSPTSANAGAAGATYKPSSDCTLYAYYKEIPAAPAFSPVAGEVEKGTSVSFSSTTEGCNFLYTTDGSDPDAKTGTQASSCTITSDCTVKVVAVKDGVVSAVSSASYTVATHTATFYVNGAKSGESVSYGNGDNITFPADPSIDDVVFIGWTKTADYDNATTAPTDLCTSATMGTEDVTYYAVFASATTTTFDPNDLTNTPSNGTLSWKNSTTGVQLKLSAGSLYTSGSPKTFTVTAGTSNYFQITSDNAPISKIVTTISTTDYKINSVSTGAKLTTSSTTQTITCSSTDVKAYATSSKQIRATQIVVTTASDFCTTVKAVTGVAVKAAPTTVAYCEGEKFNPAGLEVTLTYEDATTKDVAYTDATASKFTFSPTLNTALTTSDDHVTITINGQTANQAISVRSVNIAAPVVAEGTYTVKVGDAEAVTADGNTINALKGQKIVLASSPAEGYKVASTPFVVKDEDDANVSVSTAGGQYSFTMPGKNVTITAQFTRVYSITAGSCENGEITAIKDKDGNALTETSKGSKVVVEAAADTHYHLNGMYYVKEGDDAHNEISENEGVYSFTMPQSNVTVYATFADDTQYTVSWMVNGAEAKSEQVYANVPVSAPAVEPINGKVFRGWVSEEIDGTNSDNPSFINVTNLTVDEDKVFYAVFATETGTPETHNIITIDTDNFPSSYVAAADYTLNGVSFNITQAYINQGKLQWRAAGNSNGTGTMYNNDAMSISKITLTYDNMDSKKNFTIKVGNSANPTSGTEITGVVDANNNNVYVFDCSSENANYFVMTNGENAGYLASIDITCGGATYSDYCTTVAAPTPFIVTTADTDFYSLYLDHAVKIPENVTAYTGKLNGSNLNLTKIEGDAIPANTGIVFRTSEAGEAKFEACTDIAPFEDNDIKGVAVATPVNDIEVGEGNVLLVLGTVNGKVGFAKPKKDNLAANKAYIIVSASSEGAAKGVSFVVEDECTGISNIKIQNVKNAAYNLAGQRVNSNAKGIVIVNGKKMLNK